MRIAILSSIHWRTPPTKYGPWELIASYIAEGMVKLGHTVTLYATGDSETTARLKWICPKPIMENSGLEPKVYNSIQEHSAVYCGDELNADMPSSFGGKPRSLERGGCHQYLHTASVFEKESSVEKRLWLSSFKHLLRRIWFNSN